jgi:hypothetical protein
LVSKRLGLIDTMRGGATLTDGGGPVPLLAEEVPPMHARIVRGYAWLAFPDEFVFGIDLVVDPGHPFGTPDGRVVVADEVLYHRLIHPSDTGVCNPPRVLTYLVMTRMQHHPRLCKGWESEPAVLTDKYRSADGRVRLTRVLHYHHRHVGELMECELKVEEEAHPVGSTPDRSGLVPSPAGVPGRPAPALGS